MEVKAKKREDGMVVVEAMIILPIAILSVVLLLYLSLYLFQRANLQAGLEISVYRIRKKPDSEWKFI